MRILIIIYSFTSLLNTKINIVFFLNKANYVRIVQISLDLVLIVFLVSFRVLPKPCTYKLIYLVIKIDHNAES